MIDDLGARVDRLSDETVGLRAEVAGLRRDMTDLRKRQNAGESRFGWLAAVVAIVLVLVAVVGITAYRGLATDQRLDSFCPLLALVVGGYDPSTRKEGPDRDKYIRSFEVMRGTYDGLGCARTSPLVPPRSAS